MKLPEPPPPDVDYCRGSPAYPWKAAEHPVPHCGHRIPGGRDLNAMADPTSLVAVKCCHCDRGIELVCVTHRVKSPEHGPFHVGLKVRRERWPKAWVDGDAEIGS